MTNRDINAHSSGQSGTTCHTVQDLLPAYVTAEALGQQPRTMYPDVAAHITSCETCRAALDGLRELTLAAYADQIEPAPFYPQPDLSFLPHRSTQPSARQPWRFDEWGRLVITFSQALLDSLRPPMVVGVARGQLLYSYMLEPNTLPNLDVSIEVLAQDTQRKLSFVRVSVEALDRDPFDQEPTQVTLHAGESTWQAITDETGCAAFEAVPFEVLPSLTIEIMADLAD